MTSRLARAIVRKYPAAWRERYAAEVLELLDDSPARLADLIELTRGLLVERARALIEPGDQPRLTDWGFLVASLIPAPALVLGGAALGEQLAQQYGEAPDAVWMIALVLCAGVLVVDIGSRTVFGRRRFTPSISAGLIVAAFVFFVAFHWMASRPFDGGSASQHEWVYWLRLFAWTTMAHQFLGRHYPWRPMLVVLERYQAAVTSVRHAQADVDRCLASTDDDAPWHLVLAETALAQFERERDDARAKVDVYGYRARFPR